jgi:hypothetical protein
MDYRVYKAGVQCLIHGYDPYPIANITQYSGDEVVYGYPPHTLLFYWFLQIFFILQIIWIYYVFLLAFLVASGYLLVTADKKPEYLFCSTLLATGFISMYWNFYNGNKDILYLFLFACIFYLLIKEKFWQSSIVMGLMGSYTLFTLPFTALYLVVRRPIIDRIKYIFLSIGVVAGIFLITWLVNPGLFMSYIEMLRGSKSPFIESPGYLTPTPYLMFDFLLNKTYAGVTIPLVLVSLGYVCLIIGACWYVIRKNQEKPLIVYSFVMLSIFMVVPRIKPYDFIILVVPLYFLFKDCSDKIKIVALTVISLLPFCTWYQINHVGIFTNLTLLIYSYGQTISLFLIFAIAFALEYFRLKSTMPFDD